MEYTSAIVNECGTIKKWCSTMSQTEIEKYLELYPESKIELIEV